MTMLAPNYTQVMPKKEYVEKRNSRYSPLFDISSLEYGDVVTLGIRTSTDELRQIFKLTSTHPDMRELISITIL